MKVIKSIKHSNVYDVLKYLHKVFDNNNIQGYVKLCKNINEFYNSSKNNMSLKEIKSGIHRICPALPADTYNTVPHKHYLYRIRTIKTKSKNRLDLLDHWKESDSGAAPSKYTPYGRLNDPGQVFLYLSFEPRVALAEKRVSPGDIVACSRFEVTRTFRLVNLELNDSLKYIHKQKSSFKDKYRVAIWVLLADRNFLKKEFSDIGSNNVYRITNVIGHETFKPQRLYASGWFYPSVRVPFKSSKDDDICMDTKCAKKCLKLKDVNALLIGKNYSIKSKCHIIIH